MFFSILKKGFLCYNEAMKKLLITLLSITLLCVVFPVIVEAEDYSDTAYWTKLCTNSTSLSEEQMKNCEGYKNYVENQSDDLKKQLEEIDAKRSEISSNISEYLAKIENYKAEIDTLNAQIDELDAKIKTKEKEIASKQDEIDSEQKLIDEKNVEVAALRGTVKNRISEAQDSMRLNKYVDILMGAKTFSDFLRIANALSTVTNRNNRDLKILNALINELSAIKAQLESDKQVLETAKQELETAKADLQSKSDEVLVKQHEAEVIEAEYRKQLDEQNTNREMVTDSISDIQATMKSIADQLDRIANQNAGNNGEYVPLTSGFYHPVPGAHLSAGAGSFMYGSGALHLGADYGVNVTKGVTPVVAIGNGVILYTYDGCPDGYLNSPCGAFASKYQYYQSSWSGGGNQIVLLFVNNGGLYAAKYYHLYAGTLTVSVGDIVNGGDTLARVGTSGSSTGPHLHVELFYLGSSSNFSTFAQTWDGELEFHTGWGYDLYNHLCDQGASAPCKIHPESVFGY